MALNVETNDMQWLWTLNEEVDPNAERGYSSECQMKRNMALNAEIKISNGFERQNETQPNAKCWNEWRSGSERQMKKWIWTPSEDVALNTNWSETWLWTETKVGNGSERKYWEVMARNAEWGCGDGFERQNRECDEDGFEHRYWKVITMALNAEWRCDDGSERRNQECDEDDSEHRYWGVITMTLNAKRRCDDGSECRNRECDEDDSEHLYWEVITMALNAKQIICNGFELRTEVDNSPERQTKQNMAPNVGMNDVMAPNAEREYDSECQTEE